MSKSDPQAELDRLQSATVKSLSTEQIVDELAERGRIVDIAAKGGPEDGWFATTHGAQRCLSCRFFALSSRYKSGRGHCRIRAPQTEGFPPVHSSDWCGEWLVRFASQKTFSEPPVTPDRVSFVPNILLALDQLRTLAEKRMAGSTYYSDGRSTIAADGAKIMSLIDKIETFGLGDMTLEELQEAFDEPLPFEVTKMLEKVAGKKLT